MCSRNLDAIVSFRGTVTTVARESTRIKINLKVEKNPPLTLELNELALVESTFNTSLSTQPTNHFALCRWRSKKSERANKQTNNSYNNSNSANSIDQQQYVEKKKKKKRETERARWFKSEIMLTSAVRMLIFAVQYRLIVRSTRTTTPVLLCIFFADIFHSLSSLCQYIHQYQQHWIDPSIGPRFIFLNLVLTIDIQLTLLMDSVNVSGMWNSLLLANLF